MENCRQTWGLFPPASMKAKTRLRKSEQEEISGAEKQGKVQEVAGGGFEPPSSGL